MRGDDQDECPLLRWQPLRDVTSTSLSAEGLPAPRSPVTRAIARRKREVGPWKLGNSLGKGATGRVRAARHLVTGEPAAVKIVARKVEQSPSESMMGIKPNLIPTNGERALPIGIARELAIMAIMDHPNVVKLYDAWENRGEM